ncbi:MAG: winged helix-turn-helix transcriptional regulator [Pseudorhodoplanes sp.]|jgi:DNA-binding MarR family transcriptional regulator|nr:winged helix-turn-helix transcriptional regulator [Pseudorhodoplanes sp.]
MNMDADSNSPTAGPATVAAREPRDIEDSLHVLRILQAIDSGEKVTQRAVASELGIAVGLVNAYVKRCMKKGWVKMKSAPARRYAYYLTPAGFAEKSKLTASYFAHSFSFFRTARSDCQQVLDEASARRMRTIILVGASELAEIMILCAADQSVDIAAVIDCKKSGRVGGVLVLPDFEGGPRVDGAVITDLVDPQAAMLKAVAVMGESRVLTPAMLRVRPSRAVTTSLTALGK